MKPLIEAAIVGLCSNPNTLLSGKMAIADLGCSSGPNALALVSIAMEAIRNHFLQFQQPPPEVCVLLNDLPDNDFNMVVKRLVVLQQTNEPVCVTGIVPGSFYERLFLVAPCILSAHPAAFSGSQRCEPDTPLQQPSFIHYLIV
jgi:jasmonate O-methyltransferase